MQVVFDKTPIDNCWSSRPRPFMPEVNTATVVARHTQDHSCVARPFVSGLAFVTDDSAKKCSKMQHIFAYNGLPGGYHPVTYIFRKPSSS